MKKLILLTALTSASVLCVAQETARVISSTPIVTQVPVPRQVCSNQQVQVQSQKSGAGGIVGAIAGGAIGNSVGGGDGRAVATLLGIIGGAMLGDRIEGGGQTQSQNVQNCSTQTFYENRTTAYNVVYEFNGKQYSVQMPQDPGPTLKLQITPVTGSNSTNGVVSQADTYYSAQYSPQVQQVVPQTVYVAAPTVVQTTQYVQPYYSPLGVNLNLGWTNRDGHRHGHVAPVYRVQRDYWRNRSALDMR